MGEIAILHAADARAFSCRLSSELAAEGHSVLRREAEAAPQLAGTPDPAAHADAVVVVWSKGLLQSPGAIETARRALARRALAPVRIGGAEPPASFAHLWPIDLDGWNGETDDPRWHFVRDEIALAMRRSEIALSTAQMVQPPALRRAAEPFIAPRWRNLQGRIAAAPLRFLAPGAFSLAAIASVAVIVTAQQSDSNAAAREKGPMVAYVEPVRDPAPAPAAPEVPAPPAASLSDTDDSAHAVETAEAPSEDLFADAFAEDAEFGAPFPDENGDPVAPERAVGGPDTASPAPAMPSPAPAVAQAPPAEAPAAIAAKEPVEAAPALPVPPADSYAGLVFRDCYSCPDMTAAGTVALSRREITFDQWSACVQEKACRPASDAGFGRGPRPVINVSYEDAQSYVAWLSAKTGWRYRLPTEAEWRAAAVAEKTKLSPRNANYAAAAFGAPLPTGSFGASEYGLYDLRGNVWEWTSDCAEKEGETCKARILKGGAYDAPAEKLSADAEHRRSERARAPNIGLRVARDAS